MDNKLKPACGSLPTFLRPLHRELTPFSQALSEYKEGPQPMHNEIQCRAYALWQADNCPEGQDQAYWFKAVAELTAEAAKTIKPPRKRAAPRTKKAA
ncbi:hypothetical protein DEVEQU_03974 [Devosia equisanguinis]|uniref:DUF2934 domain-containing protein n=2 Tax=Devosia equisanguinis TaxID=2490941 RepID=A0A3S4EPD5_9HYPH|nr:hypothetical protein DEVEQU_03974 [Devosia equisanguinis]